LFGIDRNELLIDIDSLQGLARWFGIDRLRACVPVDIESGQIVPGSIRI